MASKKKYVYFGRRNTNVCYNGVSFPVAPNDVLVCPPAFIAGYIPEGQYKEVTPGSKFDTQKVRHTFGHTPMVLRQDPTGGLPMTSTPLRTTKPAGTPLTVEAAKDAQFDNPYDLTIDEPTTEVSTLHNISSSVPVPPRLELDAPLVDMDEDEDTAIDFAGDSFPEEEETENIIGKTVLRKMTKEDIYNTVVAVKATGCSWNPEMLEEFETFDETTTRGPMFKALWKYYNHDGE
jgi:hypothetical protein